MSPPGQAPQPPRLAGLLLRSVMVPEDREYALGDLAEEFEALAREKGLARARLRYWSEALRAVGPSLARRWEGAGVGVELMEHARAGRRALLRRPALTLVAVSTLALGIGSTSALFTVVDRVLLRPLPHPEAHRLVDVWNTYESWRGHEVLDPYWDRVGLSWPEYLDWREGQSSFTEVAAFASTGKTLTGRGEAVRVPVGLASSSLFPLLDLRPALGRAFAPGEEGPGAPRLAILSHEAWRDRFGADRAALGGSVTLDGEPYSVVGVLPPGVRVRSVSAFGPGEDRHEVWIPIGSDGSELDRGNRSYEAVGLLVPGVPLERAREEAATLLRGDASPDDFPRGARLAFREDELSEGARLPLLLLLAAASLLLVIACGNVATLHLGEVGRRRRELSTRLALGAGTRRVAGQLLAEGIAMGVAGSALGLVLARAAVPALLRLAPAELSLPEAVPLDGRAFLFAAALGVATGVGFALLPAMAARRHDPGEALRGRGGATSPGRAQRVVVAVELALAVPLVVVMGLLGRSLLALGAVDPGFQVAGLVTARVALPENGYSTGEATAFYHRLVDRLESLPGVAAASATTALPFSGVGGSSSFQVVGRELPGDVKQPEALRRTVMPGLVETLGLRVLEGRAILDSDDAGGPPVVLVSETLARTYWPGRSPLGERILRDRREWEVVGVVSDVLHDHLGEAPRPTFYVPFDQDEARHRMALVVRAEAPPREILPLLGAVVREMDPALPVEDEAEVRALVRRSAAGERYRAVLLGVLGILATALAGVGAFGVTARSVAARARELGIRMALGARSGRVVLGVVAREGGAVAVGVALGVLAAALASAPLAGFLYGVGRWDPLVYAAGAGLLGGVGLGAAWLAARRAARLDPVEAIRAEG